MILLQNLAKKLGKLFGGRPPVAKTVRPVFSDEERAEMDKKWRLRRIESMQTQIVMREGIVTKIAVARPLLQSGQVAEFIMAVYGKVPMYLWYTIPTVDYWTEQNLGPLWGDRGPNFGDVEVHERLRIRNAKVLKLELRVRGETIKLEALGYLSFLGPNLNDVPMLLEYVQEHDEPYAGFIQGTNALRIELATLLAQKT